jgi:hypothetical protein
MAYERGKNAPIFGISLTPKYVSGRMTRFFGTTVEAIALTRSPKKQTDFYKNLHYWTLGAFDHLGNTVSTKINQSFVDMKDPNTGKKWKKLAKKTLRARRESGKTLKFPEDPLYFTGKMHTVAIGWRLKTKSGGSGQQKTGNIRTDGLQLVIRNNYQLGESAIAGSYMWRLDGPKARHLYGYTEQFQNVYRGKKSEKKNYVVPARPFVPKFNNSFFSSWKKTLTKDFQKIILATEKNSTLVTTRFERGSGNGKV